jgi:D-amino-acid oxidase
VARTDVVVVGAGVIGLTSAVCLAEAGLTVACWTAEPPQQTTSSVAGALWANSPHAAPGDRLTAWTRSSLPEFRDLAEQPQSGVRLATGVLASRDSAEPPPPQMFPGVEVSAREPAPSGYLAAFAVEVPLIDMGRYLEYLQERLQAAGAEVVTHPVDALSEAAAAAEVVVNCTGLGARELVDDRTLEPVRGQHVLVENPGLDEFFIDDRTAEEWTCWFPHGHRVVLGGIAQRGATAREPDPSVAERIVERCAAVDPRLGSARVLGQQVGFRPARPSVRLEEERLSGATCIHNYGHGRSGVTLSWGCAREVQEIVIRRARGS